MTKEEMQVHLLAGKHIWDYCDHCKVAMVRCGGCGNNCCNGTYGVVNGSPCTKCASAYAMQDEGLPSSTVKFSELADVDDANYLAKLRAISSEPKRITLAKLDAKIKAFEASHGFDSATMMSKLSAGEIEETSAICDWLMDLDLRGRLKLV
jgi:hypothetical protein